MRLSELKLAANRASVLAMRAAESLRCHMDNGWNWNGDKAKSLVAEGDRLSRNGREAWRLFDAAFAHASAGQRRVLQLEGDAKEASELSDLAEVRYFTHLEDIGPDRASTIAALADLVRAKRHDHECWSRYAEYTATED